MEQTLGLSIQPRIVSSDLGRWGRMLVSSVLGAQANRLSPSYCATLRQRFSAPHLKWRFPLPYGLWRELNSLPHRILENHERGLSENGLHLGAAIHTLPDGVRQRDADGHSRIEDIRNLQKVRPWATPRDIL
jgi:hypothetical protein